MAENEILVRVAAETSQAVQGVKHFNAELSKTAKTVPSVATAIEKTNRSLATIRPGANQAGNALMNLGRIAQDAPFGFIGISNNINPLLESFQRLRAESGSTGNALKALLSSLTGGAGIGLAVSVVTGLLTVFGSKLFAAKKSTDELSESAKAYAEAQRNTAESIQKQVIEVESLVRIATSDVYTKKQQADALTKLNELIPDNIGKLDALNIKTGEGVRIIREYTKALEDQATAELLRGRAAELRVKLFDAEAKKNQDLTKLFQQRVQLEEQMKNNARIIGGNQFGTASLTLAGRVEQQLKQVENDFKATITTYENTRKEVNTELERLRGEIDRNTAGGLTVDIKEPKELKVKAPKEVKVKEIILAPEQVSIKGNLQDQIAQELASLDISDQFGKINNFKIPFDLARITPELTALSQQMQAEMNAIQERAETLGNALQQTLGPAIQGFFVDIMSGGQNALQSFGQAIQQIVTKLIAATLQTAIFAAIISAITGTPFSTSFKGLMGGAGLPKFAEGGIVTKPTLGLFGEAGTEAVIPLDRLSSMVRGMSGGGGLSEGQLVTILRGQDIALSYQRTVNQRGSSFR